MSVLLLRSAEHTSKLLVACAGSCLLAACGGTRDSDARTIAREVEAQIAVARDATIPAGITLSGSSGPKREAHWVRADWAFEAPADWQRYLEGTVASLRRSGYEPVGTGGLAYAKHVPGDVYRVHIARGESSPASRVTVTFHAGPD